MVVFRDHFCIVCAERDVVIKARPGLYDRGDAGDVDSKIAGLWARILYSGAVHPVAALVLAGSSALAQESRGTEQQRVACACVHRQTFPTVGRVELDGLVRWGHLKRDRCALVTRTTDYQNGEHGAASDVM